MYKFKYVAAAAILNLVMETQLAVLTFLIAGCRPTPQWKLAPNVHGQTVSVCSVTDTCTYNELLRVSTLTGTAAEAQ